MVVSPSLHLPSSHAPLPMSSSSVSTKTPSHIDANPPTEPGATTAATAIAGTTAPRAMPWPTPPPPPTHALRRAVSDTALHRPSRVRPSHSPLPLIPLPRRAHREEYDALCAARFASRVVSAVNDSAICLLISIGHQLGLFSVLARLSARPRSVATIARCARGLHARYVREWLCAMACVGIVEEAVEPCGDEADERRKYRLPAEHAAVLTWGGCAGNLALVAQYVPILGRLEDRVAGCFRTGTGLEGAAFAHLDSVMRLDTLQTVGDGVERWLLGKVGGLVRTLEEGAWVLCVGGHGDAVFLGLARRFPRSWFTCYGGSAQQVKAARKLVGEGGAGGNVHFRVGRGGLEEVEEQGSYDVGLVLDGWAVRNSGRPAERLGRLCRALKKGCPLLYVETMAEGNPVSDQGHAAGALLYALSAMHCVPRAMQAVDGKDAVGGVWGIGCAKQAMVEAGFVDVDVKALNEDGLHCVLIGRRPEE